ncbi:MAG: HigA family addiction module antitoxin [Candidatus Thiodiazotropha sp. 6PLUC7]
MTIRSHNPPHPGELILRTYIEPFEGVSIASVARELGVNKSTFNRLVNCKADISPEMAVRLSAVLGRNAESWLCSGQVLLATVLCASQKAASAQLGATPSL